MWARAGVPGGAGSLPGLCGSRVPRGAPCPTRPCLGASSWSVAGSPGGEAAAWAGGPPGAFRTWRAAAGPPGSGASYVRPAPPAPPRSAALGFGPAEVGVGFPANSPPSPLFSRLSVGACLEGVGHLSADPGKQVRGAQCARGRPPGEARCPAVGIAVRPPHPWPAVLRGGSSFFRRRRPPARQRWKLRTWYRHSGLWGPETQ